MQTPSAREYRPDIDGLRALAILPVVAYHVGAPGFGGGFIGVDVFFVISGFLITRQLLDDQAAHGRIDLLDFYARRARRIVPALALMLLAVTAAGAIWLSPSGEQQDVAKSAVAAAGSVSNLWFWRSQSGYFGGRSEYMPLLHTWSLAVEEQFYLAWPLVLMMLGGRRRAVVRLLVIGCALSLGVAAVLAYVRPMAAFFNAPTRAWELGLGALLASSAIRPRLSARVWTWLAAAGLAAIVLSAVGYTVKTPFPGLAALPPVLGAAVLLLAAEPGASQAAARVMGWPPFARLGRLSYGWYLWHWPLLSIVRIVSLEQSWPRDAALAIVALGLAAASHHLIETPVRRDRPGPFASRNGSLWAGAALLAASMVASTALYGVAQWHRKTDPWIDALAAAQMSPQYVPRDCVNLRPPSTRDPDPRDCMVGPHEATKTVLLLGDSHALHLIPAMEAAGGTLGFRTLLRSQTACRPEWSRPRPARPPADLADIACPQFNARTWGALPDLKRDFGLEVVVVSAHWTWRSPDEAELQALVDRLRAAGLKVVLALDNPSFDREVPQCLAHHPRQTCDTSRAKVERERQPNTAIEQRIAARTPGVTLWDPTEALCSNTLCPASVGGEVLYRDTNHLTREGAARLTPSLTEALARAL